jgi:hypothetical protein
LSKKFGAEKLLFSLLRIGSFRNGLSYLPPEQVASLRERHGAACKDLARLHNGSRGGPPSEHVASFNSRAFCCDSQP